MRVCLRLPFCNCNGVRCARWCPTRVSTLMTSLSLNLDSSLAPTMSQALPDAAVCSTISQLTVQDQNGTEHKLADLLPDGRKTVSSSIVFRAIFSSQGLRGQIVVLIRHFRCGLCQDYLVYLMQQAAIIVRLRVPCSLAPDLLSRALKLSKPEMQVS